MTPSAIRLRTRWPRSAVRVGGDQRATAHVHVAKSMNLTGAPPPPSPAGPGPPQQAGQARWCFSISISQSARTRPPPCPATLSGGWSPPACLEGRERPVRALPRHEVARPTGDRAGGDLDAARRTIVRTAYPACSFPTGMVAVSCLRRGHPAGAMRQSCAQAAPDVSTSGERNTLPYLPAGA
jgi:hypothetical protein